MGKVVLCSKDVNGSYLTAISIADQWGHCPLVLFIEPGVLEIRVLGLGAFALDHLQYFEPILLLHFTNFLTAGSILITPRIKGILEFLELPMGTDETDVFPCLRYTGPFATPSANFVLSLFHLSHFQSAGPILITAGG